jgi:ABC-type glycerol-3-phosphate transport system permease component
MTAAYNARVGLSHALLRSQHQGPSAHCHHRARNLAINQPFKLCMLPFFFLSIPTKLSKSAMLDSCTRVRAFRLAIFPAMWPVIITTCLFSFLLAHNDIAVTTRLVSQDNQTTAPS